MARRASWSNFLLPNSSKDFTLQQLPIGTIPFRGTVFQGTVGSLPEMARRASWSNFLLPNSSKDIAIQQLPI